MGEENIWTTHTFEWVIKPLKPNVKLKGKILDVPNNWVSPEAFSTGSLMGGGGTLDIFNAIHTVKTVSVSLAFCSHVFVI